MMRRWLVVGVMALVPVVVCGLLSGCSEDYHKRRREGKGPSTQGDTSKVAENKPLTELESTGWGKVTGRFVSKDAPKPAEIAAMKTHTDRGVCLAGGEFEKVEQTWRVGSGGGVANVVVWVQPPEFKYFKIRDDLRTLPNVKLEQPHCAFVPHVVAYFPKYRDKTGLKATGQQLEVVNDSSVPHNFKTPTKNVQMGPGVSQNFTFDPADEPIKAECSIHSWMNAYIWAFDHPYFVVTKDDGRFEINAPAGTQLTVRAWHEAKRDWDVETITVEDGQTQELGERIISAR
jgi:hypothetical protein